MNLAFKFVQIQRKVSTELVTILIIKALTLQNWDEMIVTSFPSSMFNPILSQYWAFGWMTSVEYQILLNLIFFLFFRIFIFLLQKNGMLVFGGFTLSLSYQLRWSLSYSDNFIYFSENLIFFLKNGSFFWERRILILGLGQQLGWSLKLINLRMRLIANFFNIMLKKLVMSLIFKLISLRLQPNCQSSPSIISSHLQKIELPLYLL